MMIHTDGNIKGELKINRIPIEKWIQAYDRDKRTYDN